MIEANKARILANASELKKKIPKECLEYINGKIRDLSGRGRYTYNYNLSDLTAGQISSLCQYLEIYGYQLEWVDDTLVISWGDQE